MTTTAEDQAKRAEQASRDASSAVVGAQAVADAVKKAADASVTAARAAKAAGPEGDFAVSGMPGGRFTIRGDGFSSGGTVLLNGKQLFTDEWGGQLIRGRLPSDAKSGEVVVWIDEKTQKRGYLKLA